MSPQPNVGFDVQITHPNGSHCRQGPNTAWWCLLPTALPQQALHSYSESGWRWQGASTGCQAVIRCDGVAGVLHAMVQAAIGHGSSNYAT